MPDYKESGVAGKSWRRFGRVVIDNPRNGAPSVLCVENEVIALADTEIVREVGNLNFPFNPDASFPILNPVTNEPTGQMAVGALVHALIYSYVMFEAHKRDEAEAAAAAAKAAAAQS